MKNKGSKHKSKKKGSENAFGCDLSEHLQSSGHDVPQVLKKCAEFIEKHGIVDGIYRLSGVTSNIQRLRQEFCSEACPDLTKEVYLQDIHCVGSLCKLYFRELPNPLLTYELYSKFTEAVTVQGDHEKLTHIQNVITELPSSHFRTLEYLTKHLAHLATLSTETNMHTRNLALVWAPNLLRSKDIEVSSCNGDMAFQEVRIQQSVVEFILNHTEQIFSRGDVQIKPKEGLSLVCGDKYATLPISGQCGPMKLMSLEEAQARSLSPNHPVHKERQRENSLPDASTATLYHTVIDIADNKRKFSGKSKKWKSIFNLGKSVTDSKGKLSRNGSVFIRGPSMTEKALRPARSMESLCSLQTDDDRVGNVSPVYGSNRAFLPDVKSRTLGSDSLYDLSEEEQNWELKGKKSVGAVGGSSPNMNRRAFGSASSPQQKALPEQLKVFKGEDLSSFQPTSPKNRRMLYSGSAHSSSSSSSRPSFPGSFFPLESSPRHQRKAVNISEPFAVSVPLRVSAVISSNSTPCRGHVKDKPAAASMKPCRESPVSEQTDIGKSNSVPPLDMENQETPAQKCIEETISKYASDDLSEELSQDSKGRVDLGQFSELENSSHLTARGGGDLTPPPEKPSIASKLDMGSCPIKTELWSVHQELKITEPEIDIMDETFKPIFCPQSTRENMKLKADVQSKRSCSSSTLSLKEQAPGITSSDPSITAGSAPVRKQQSESDILLPSHKTFDFVDLQPRSLDLKGEKENKMHKVAHEIKPLNTDKPADIEHWKVFPAEQRHVSTSLKKEGDPTDTNASAESQSQEEPGKMKVPQAEEKACCDGIKKSRQTAELAGILRLSICFENKRNTLELPNLDDEDVCGRRLEELDLVESWEELSSTKQWVTSPLHSPAITDLFGHLPMSPSCPGGGGFSSGEGTPSSQSSSHSVKNDKQANISAKLHSGNGSPSSTGNPETKGTYLQPLPARINAASNNATQPHAGKSSTAKQRNSLSSQRFHRQMSQEPSPPSERTEENCYSKHRPYSLNLDIGYRCIRDISNQQILSSSELSSCQHGLPSTSGIVNRGLSMELDAFLNDRQAPLRRNSAPVSVSSVRTAFMIKTCQAKAVPVVPPKVQYSQIPHSRPANDADMKEREKECPHVNVDKTAPPQTASDAKEELENKNPASKIQRQSNGEKSAECAMTAAAPDLPVMMRRKPQNVDLFVDCPRPNRANLLQRPSFRNRQRPQSLILLSPPFPIMDYPPLGDDGKLLLSPIKSLPDTSTISAFSKDMAENLRAAEGINLHSKMTIPKSGQRLETSTSCFYQPQRRSMIFDSRGHRQIE